MFLQSKTVFSVILVPDHFNCKYMPRTISFYCKTGNSYNCPHLVSAKNQFSRSFFLFFSVFQKSFEIFLSVHKSLASPIGQQVKVFLQCRRCRFDPWVRKIPWRREWQPTPVLLPGESHGQRSLAGYSPQGCKEVDTTERLSTITYKYALTHMHGIF